MSQPSCHPPKPSVPRSHCPQPLLHLPMKQMPAELRRSAGSRPASAAMRRTSGFCGMQWARAGKLLQCCSARLAAWPGFQTPHNIPGSCKGTQLRAKRCQPGEQASHSHDSRTQVCPSSNRPPFHPSTASGPQGTAPFPAEPGWEPARASSTEIRGGTHYTHRQVAHREQHAAQRCRLHRGQEVGLVLLMV